MPPYGVSFSQGTRGVEAPPPTGFVPSSCVGEAVVALRQLISSRLDVKLLFPFRHQIP